MLLSPALLYLRPTPAANDLAATMAAAVADATYDEAATLTLAALAPLLGRSQGAVGGALRATLLPPAAFLSAADLLRAPRPAERLCTGGGVAAVHAGGGGGGGVIGARERMQALDDYMRGRPEALNLLARAAKRLGANSGQAAAGAVRGRAHPPRKLWSNWRGPLLAA